MLIKIIFKDSKEAKKIKNHVSKHNLYIYFLTSQKFLIFGENHMLISAELKECVTWFIHFMVILWVKYRMCVTDSERRGLFGIPPAPPPIRMQPQKGPSWVWLTSVNIASSNSPHFNVSNFWRQLWYTLHCKLFVTLI